MATMQDHPIDLVRAQMALVARQGGRGLLGLGCGLVLIGLLWLGALKPADAAAINPGPEILASALVEVQLGAAAPQSTVAVVIELGVPVCRLVIDPEAEVPLPGTCAPAAMAVLHP